MDTAHLYLEQDRNSAGVEDCRALVHDLLLQAARFKALAAAADDQAVHDEFAVLACHCDAVAATLLRHARGRQQHPAALAQVYARTT